MIDILVQLAHGFVNCLTPLNMAMLLIGIVIGQIGRASCRERV